MWDFTSMRFGYRIRPVGASAIALVSLTGILANCSGVPCEGGDSTERVPAAEAFLEAMDKSRTQGEQAIYEAAIRGDIEAFERLNLEVSREVLSESLSVTADPAVARVLLDAGAVPSYRNQGMTPLHAAAWYGREEVAAVLIAAGSDLDARTSSEFFALTDPQTGQNSDQTETTAYTYDEDGTLETVVIHRMVGWTPFMLAISQQTQQHWRLASQLAESGADVNARNCDDRTVWMVLAERVQGTEDVKALGTLLERFRANPALRDSEGRTALEIAQLAARRQ
jgi:hypothetical protein